MKWFTIPIRLPAIMVAVLWVSSAYPDDKSSPEDPASSQSSQPTWNSLASPQDTMFTFLEAGAQLLQGHEEARQRVSKYT